MKLTPVVNFIDPFFGKNYAAILSFDSADATRDINYTKKKFYEIDTCCQCWETLILLLIKKQNKLECLSIAI